GASSMTAEYVVANVEDVPEGSHIVVKVQGREIGVFNVKGQYYALANACFHQNGPLCRGAVSGTLVSRSRNRLEACLGAGRRDHRVSLAFVGIRYHQRPLSGLSEP